MLRQLGVIGFYLMPWYIFGTPAFYTCRIIETRQCCKSSGQALQ